MSLQFILGRANTKKREFMLDRVASILETEPDASIFYIVPEHMTFSTEMSVMEYLSNKPFFKNRSVMGMIQLQVYSFSRLAWFFLQDSAIYNRTQLTEAGLSMLVRKILREWEEELTIYRGESRHSGFVQRVTEMLLELRRGEVTIEDLDALIASFSSDPSSEDAALKLKDITLLYQNFTQSLFGKYIETEQILDSLIEKMKFLDLSNTYFFIDGFHHFSAKEQKLLIEMMTQSKRVEISLTLDKAYPNEKPDKLNLFYQTGETYFRLFQTAKSSSIKIHFDHILKEPSRKYCMELNLLEDYWVKSNEESNPHLEKPVVSLDDCLTVWEAENKQAEVLHAANQIRTFTSDGSQTRYKDILILVRDIEEYRSILMPIFHENGLEVFVDKAETMSNHPLVEALSSLFSIYRKNWRSHDILRFLRTELFVPEIGPLSADKEERLNQLRQAVEVYREKIDVTENVVLAYGYEGNYWTRKEKWTYTTFELDDASEQTNSDKQIEATANEVKKIVSGTLEPFFKKLSKSKTNAQAAKVLYQFLEQTGITTQLLFWRDDAIEKGDLDTARKQEQVWKNFIQLLDEFVDVLGDEEWDSDTFVSILETGFENATYSMVPPRIDQVILSDLTNTQPNPSSIVFMLGLTDQHLPANSENHSVLTEEERSLISGSLEEGKYLRPLAEDLVATEPFIAYNAFLNASKKLFLSYPIKNDGSGDNKISPYVQRIANHFNLSIDYKPAEAISLADFDYKKTDELLSFVGSPRTTLSQVLLVMRKSKEEEHPPSGFWLELFRYFSHQYKENPFMTTLLNSLDKRNKPKSLTPALSKMLYGEDLYLSISQLETFYLDPYSHFLRYGLRLKERPVQELTPAATGSFFHEALDQIFQTIIQEDLSLKDMSEKKLRTLSDTVLEKIFEKNAYKILSVSNQMKFVRQQLGKTIQRMMWAMVHQSQHTTMETVKTEVLFGRLGGQQGIPALEYPLRNGGRLQLRGKIDRIDALHANEQLYLSIVDYKSSDHAVKFEDLYNGTALQMMTYLDAALSNSELLFNKKAHPAGAFYSHVKNPFIKLDKDINSEKIENERLKTHKMDGLIVKEEDVLDALDLTISEGGNSIVYPYGRTKNGYRKDSKFVTLDELHVLQQHNKKLILHAGNAILDGEISLAPYKEKRTRTPSVNGEYNAISQFDVLNDDHYRILETNLTNEEIIKKMKEDLQEEDSDL